MKDLDIVRTLHTVYGIGEELVPIGTEGTIVATYQDGAAFCVEFTEPQCIADIGADWLELVEDIDDAIRQDQSQAR